MKKKPILLLETMIALILTAILMTFLFSFFTQSAKMDKKLDAIRMAVSSLGYLQMRLQDLFLALDSSQLKSPIFTQPSEDSKRLHLYVTFDNGIDPSPEFSGIIQGKICLEEGNLCLISWPKDAEREKPSRKEILLTDISDFSCEFFGEPMITKKAPLEWQQSWPANGNRQPCMIRFHVTQKKRNTQFAFPLQSGDLPIIF